MNYPRLTTVINKIQDSIKFVESTDELVEEEERNAGHKSDASAIFLKNREYN